MNVTNSSLHNNEDHLNGIMPDFVFKKPGKPSKQETLLSEDYFIMPVSDNYIDSCYMALYLKNLSIQNPDEYKMLLDIFNNSIEKCHKKSQIQLFMSLSLHEIDDYFPNYLDHIITSLDASRKLNQLDSPRLPDTLPPDLQVYLYVPNEIGIQMDRRTFPDPSKIRVKILETRHDETTSLEGKMISVCKIFYHVVIKRKSIS